MAFKYKYKVIKSKKRKCNISITVESSGLVVVRAPFRATDYIIEQILESKLNWIEGRITALKTNAAKYAMPQNGESIKIFGENYIVEYCNCKKCAINGTTFYIPEKNGQVALKQYAKEQLQNYLQARLNYFSDICSLNYKSYSVRWMVSRWGSCSQQNRLHFSSRLAFCPVCAIDYVIVHELCHIKYKNHGQYFKRLLGTIMPDYKECEKVLKEYSGYLREVK